MTNLKPCPCGEVPTELLWNLYDEHNDAHFEIFGHCCGKWAITPSFDGILREVYYECDDAEDESFQDVLRDLWNAAPRGKE